MAIAANRPSTHRRHRPATRLSTVPKATATPRASARRATAGPVPHEDSAAPSQVAFAAPGRGVAHGEAVHVNHLPDSRRRCLVADQHTPTKEDEAMSSLTLLKTFVTVCLVLLLLVSLKATHDLAAFFHADDPLAWAFALSVELGIVGLGIGVYVATRDGRNPRAFSYSLVAVLGLSVLSNFLIGADTFNPSASLIDAIRAWKFWWLLPLVCTATIPLLTLRMTELATSLWLQHPIAATRSRRQPSATTIQPSGLVVQVIRVYEMEPATPLSRLAEHLRVSASEASRLRLQAMNLGLLQRKAPGYYLPIVSADHALLSSGSGNGEEGHT